jgi:4-hydroxy-tetrahydrodipicolinate reductase
MINIILVGACGKMSSAVVSSLAKEKDIKIIGGIEAAGNPMLGSPIGDGFIQADFTSIIKDTDVVVEFAIPEVTLDNVKIASKANKPYIIGTTGLKDLNEIKKYSKQIPVLISANFSLGVNILYNLTESAARSLKDFDIEIIEAHHKMKRDAPSGTAKNLAEIIRSAAKKDKIIYGRKGIIGPRNKNEIGVMSIRGGDIVGEHNIMFIGNGERIELIHRATGRNAFASGVTKAIRFITKQKPGLYSMQDVITAP